MCGCACVECARARASRSLVRRRSRVERKGGLLKREARHFIHGSPARTLLALPRDNFSLSELFIVFRFGECASACCVVSKVAVFARLPRLPRFPPRFVQFVRSRFTGIRYPPHEAGAAGQSRLAVSMAATAVPGVALLLPAAAWRCRAVCAYARGREKKVFETVWAAGYARRVDIYRCGPKRAFFRA